MAEVNLSDLRAQGTARSARWHRASSRKMTLAEWAVGVAGETGEACNIVRKIVRKTVDPEDPGVPESLDALHAMLADECADVLIYLDLLAHCAGIDLAAAVISKFNRTSDRFGFPERLGHGKEETKGLLITENPWGDMKNAPRDGRLLRLLVSGGGCPTDDDTFWPTIGHNNFDNDGEDVWRFAGWCWEHDHFTSGDEAKNDDGPVVIGWRAYLD